METLEKLRAQMDSLHRLSNLVKTMKALAAANIRQYEQSVTALSGYFRTVERGLYVLLRDSGAAQPPPEQSRHKRVAVIVFGSDYGLCGRFNEDITTFTLNRLQALGIDSQQRRVLALGGRVTASLERDGQEVDDTLLLPGSAAQITSTVQALTLLVDAWQAQHQIQAVYLFYNRQLSGQQIQPVGFKVWPVELSRFKQLEEERWPARSIPTYTMPGDQLLAQLLRQYLFVTMFRACAESQASEHSSRLSSMQAAEHNLEEHLQELTGTYRRTRQESITTELMDIVSGYESMRK